MTTGLSGLPNNDFFNQDYVIEQPEPSMLFNFGTVSNDECEFIIDAYPLDGAFTLESTGFSIVPATFTQLDSPVDIFSYNGDGGLSLFTDNYALDGL